MQTRSSWIWCWIIGAVLASSASAQVYVSLIDNLPTCIGNRNGRIISVSDAVDDSDCSVGGATGENRFVHPCICDTLNALGPYWKAVGGGSGGAGDVLLAGDADGQVIQGRTGANAARVDIGETSIDEAKLIGSGATPASAYADNAYAGLKSPDTNSDCSVTNGAVSCNSDGAVTFSVNPTGGYFGADTAGFYAGSAGGSGASIDIGKTVPDEAKLIGGGATSGSIKAYTDGVFASSPDLGTSFDLYDGGIDIASDGSSSFYGVTATNIGVAGGSTSINGSRVNVASSQTPPTNANDACTTGDTIDTATFHYYCAATDTWVRVAMATW